MKKNLLLLLLVAMFGFVSCDDDTIDNTTISEESPTEVEEEEEEIFYDWDYSPVDIYFKVSNTDDEDLLDQSVEGNILSNDISLTYDGVTYTLEIESENESESDIQQSASRASAPAIFNGLSFIESTVYYNTLTFGEFEGNEDLDIEMVLDLGTGQSYNLRYVRDFEHPDQTESPIIETTLYIDEVQHYSSIFSIVL